MKYWIRKPGASDMSGPLSLEAIEGQIATGSLSVDLELLAAQGQSLGLLKRSQDWTPLSAFISPPVPSTDESQQIDSNTNQLSHPLGSTQHDSEIVDYVRRIHYWVRFMGVVLLINIILSILFGLISL